MKHLRILSVVMLLALSVLVTGCRVTKVIMRDVPETIKEQVAKN